MEHGYLYASRMESFPWYPEGEKLPVYIRDFKRQKRGGIIFGEAESEPCTPDRMSFYICKACKKGVADNLTES